MRTLASIASERSRASPRPTPGNASPSCRATVIDGLSARPGSWYTIDTLRRRSWRSPAWSSPVTSCPSTSTWPARMKPWRGRARSAANAAVDLPQPLSPTSPYVSPGAMANDTPRSTSCSTPRAR